MSVAAKRFRDASEPSTGEEGAESVDKRSRPELSDETVAEHSEAATVTTETSQSKTVVSPLSSPISGTSTKLSVVRPLPPPESDRIRQKLLSRIDKDLAPWAEGITAEHMKDMVRANIKGVHLKIKKGVVHVVSARHSWRDRNAHTINLVKHICSLAPIPDTELVISCDDVVPDAFAKKLPIFAMCKSDTPDNLNILYPEHTFVGWHNGWGSFLDSMSSGQFDVPWEDKVPMAMFRGADTNKYRSGVAALATRKAYKPSLDILCNEWTKDAKDFVAMEHHSKWRYLVHFPGRSYAGRLKYLLTMDSVVIWCQDEWKEFWYDVLVPGEHCEVIDLTSKPSFTSVADSIASIVQRYEADQDAAKAMADNGRAFIHDCLSLSNVEQYWILLLQKYAALTRFTP